MFTLDRLDHVAIAVRDVDRSVRWYRETLGLAPMHAGVWGNCPALVGVGGTAIALFPASDEEPGGTRTIQHVAFRTDRSNFDAARSDLAALGIDAVFQDHGIAHSLYVRDPDGHQVEITTWDVP